MPAHYICDGGCGATTDSPKEWSEYGYAHKTRYCPKCREAAEEYQKELNALHDRLQKSWKFGLSKLRKAYRKNLPKGTLPDVRD